jgi:hypothetical protein|tara:strand:+ start:3624 stop:4997 length:1374 start_codon:yes stop_codon:yes gene_type:complete
MAEFDPDAFLAETESFDPDRYLAQTTATGAGGVQTQSFEPVEPYSGTILPFTRGADGNVSFDSNAGLVGVAKRGVMATGEVIKGELDPTSKEGMMRALEAATMMSPMSAASRAGAAGGKSALMPRGKFETTTTKAVTPTAKELKGQANKIYTSVENVPVRVRPEAFERVLGGIGAKVTKEGYAPGLHPKSSAALAEIAKYAGRELDMQDMTIIRRLAKGAKNSLDPDDSRIGRVILGHIDDNMRQIPGVGKELAQADKLWSMAKKSELLDNAVEAAKHTASGFENGLRIEFRKLLKKEREGKLQLSEAEKAAMSRVEQGNFPTNFLKGIGKLGPAPGGAGNALLAVLAGGGGYAIGGPAGMAAVMGTGYGARLGARELTKGAAEKAQTVVAGGTPASIARGSYRAPVPSAVPDTMAKALLSQLIQEGKSGGMAESLSANEYPIGPNGGQMIDGVEYF